MLKLQTMEKFSVAICNQNFLLIAQHLEAITNALQRH